MIEAGSVIVYQDPSRMYAQSFHAIKCIDGNTYRLKIKDFEWVKKEIGERIEPFMLSDTIDDKSEGIFQGKFNQLKESKAEHTEDLNRIITKLIEVKNENN